MPSLLSRLRRWIPHRTEYDTFTSTEPLDIQDEEDVETVPTKAKRRDLLAFFVIGLINNFSYVVMLSAAEDILEASAAVEGFLLPTGAVLLADILPTLVIKLLGPLFMHFIPYKWRVSFCVVLGVASFHTVAWTQSSVVSLTGVCFASIASGFGEITFLSLTSHYNKSTVGAWSSGTGGAGLAGAGIYAAMVVGLGISHQMTLVIVSIAPIILLIFFFFVLSPIGSECDPLVNATSPDPNSTDISHTAPHDDVTVLVEQPKKQSAAAAVSSLPFLQRVKLIRPLLRYMAPLFLVYFAEYLINQGVSPLIVFSNDSMSDRDTYVYYQFLYQAGVFISRSSVEILPIRRIFVPSILQACNLVVAILQVTVGFIPSVYIVFVLIFWEGLLGGSVYVNAFHNMSQEVDPSYREWCLGVASVADTFGIATSGMVAVFLEPFLRIYRVPR